MALIFLWSIAAIVFGVLASILGVGGGAFMVPFFTLALGMSQHQAHATALAAMLPPVLIFAVWKYHQAGMVNVKLAIVMALGMALGSFLIAPYVQKIPADILRKGFGVFLILMAIKILLTK